MRRPAGFGSKLLRRYLLVAALAVGLACVSFVSFAVRVERMHEISDLLQKLGNDAFRVAFLEQQFMVPELRELGSEENAFISERNRLLGEADGMSRKLIRFFPAKDAVQVENLMEALNRNAQVFDRLLTERERIRRLGKAAEQNLQAIGTDLENRIKRSGDSLALSDLLRIEASDRRAIESVLGLPPDVEKQREEELRALEKSVSGEAARVLRKYESAFQQYEQWRRSNEVGDLRHLSFQTAMQLDSRIAELDQFWSVYDEGFQRRAFFAIFFWLAMIPVLSFFFVRLTANSFAKPMTDLAKYILQIGTGDLDAQPPSGLDAGEFHLLAETLAETAANLKKTMVSRQELSKSQALLETIMHGITDGIITTDMEGKILYTNSAACLLFDVNDHKSALGKNVRDLASFYGYFDESGAPIPWSEMPIAQARAGVSQLPRTIRARRPGGDPENDRYAVVQAIALCDEYEKLSVVVAVIREITDQRRADIRMLQQKVQLAHSARLSSIGEMAAGIAHEINNPLSVIQRRGEQIIEGLDDGSLDPDQVRAYAEKIVGFSQRISKIIRSLKSLSRDGERDPFERVSAATLIDDCLELCREKFRNHDVELEVSVPPGDLSFECRATQISQILLNLLTNALDAAEGRSTDGKKWVRVEARKEAGEVVIRVSDSGPGIPPELRSKIGIPFFTTKEAGKGTGLGVSVSRRIAHLHHGTLKLDPAAGVTCFVLRLPEKQPSSRVQAA